jgi:hypothetical protein
MMKKRRMRMKKMIKNKSKIIRHLRIKINKKINKKKVKMRNKKIIKIITKY